MPAPINMTFDEFAVTRGYDPDSMSVDAKYRLMPEYMSSIGATPSGPARSALAVAGDFWSSKASAAAAWVGSALKSTAVTAAIAIAGIVLVLRGRK